MAQSLDQVFIHSIFSTKDRFPFFQTPEILRETHAYLATVAGNLNCPAIKIGGVSDHVHMLTRLPRTLTIADFLKETKRVSGNWLRDRGGEWKKFYWQGGYGVFSVSVSKLERVEKYITNQAEHHRTKSFREEYLEFLQKHQVEYDERFLWD